MPFLGADKSVARRTQKYFYDNNSKRPIQVETYMMVKSALYVFLGIVMGALLMLMSKFQFGRKLLLDVSEKIELKMFFLEKYILKDLEVGLKLFFMVILVSVLLFWWFV